MKIKEIKSITFLFYRVQTTVNELSSFFGVAPRLFKEATSLNLLITGPMHWHYFGFTDPSKPFTLEIALPVGEVPKEYDGEFHVKRTDPFKCISTMHEGNWLNIPSTYTKLMQFASEQNLKITSNNREIYINVDFKYPDANETEIQMGVQ